MLTEEEQIPQTKQHVTNDFKGILSEAKDKKVLQRYYQDNPYVVLAAAAAAGYILGGGLFSPFSRRLLRIGMQAVFIPTALTKISDLTSGS